MGARRKPRPHEGCGTAPGGGRDLSGSQGVACHPRAPTLSTSVLVPPLAAREPRVRGSPAQEPERGGWADPSRMLRCGPSRGQPQGTLAAALPDFRPLPPTLWWRSPACKGYGLKARLLERGSGWGRVGRSRLEEEDSRRNASKGMTRLPPARRRPKRKVQKAKEVVTGPESLPV